MFHKQRLSSLPKACLAICLAWAAGFADAAGWLVVNHVYTSHMTGNTASFAHDLYIAKWDEAWYHGWPIIPFIGGLLYSAAATKFARRSGFHSSFSIALITEIVLLAAIVSMRASGYLLLSMMAAAMGIQTVTVTPINGLRVFTTYLTGSLAKFSEAIVDYLFWFRDRTRGRFWKRLGRALAVSPRQSSLQHAALTMGLWSGFFAGAFCGVATELRAGLSALVAPMAVLAAAVIVDLRSPVAAADEQIETWSGH
ncbi:MAG: YoaK family protein [Bryobacteraceae bacterium]